MTSSLYTIGYEGSTVEALIRTLQASGVRTLLDVRAVPLSRKPGFSKNKLASRLAEHDILYVSLRGLGTPSDGRVAARRGQKAELVRIYGQHMQTPDAQSDLQEALRIASKTPSCLIVFRALSELLPSIARGGGYGEKYRAEHHSSRSGVRGRALTPTPDHQYQK